MKEQIVQILKDLRKELPLDVWKFKDKFKDLVNCEFYFDEIAKPKKEFNVTKNIKIYIYEREFVEVICNEEAIELEFRTIYVDDLKNNNIIIVWYEV